MTAPPKRIRLQDLADRLGVTKAAVSLALRNQPSVSPGLRASAHALAAELGYRPNPLVAAHMAEVRGSRPPGYRATLAFVSTRAGGPAGTRRCPRDSRYWEGARDRAHQLGYELALFSTTAPRMTEARLGGILASRGISGVVVGPLERPEGTVRLPWETLSAAAIGYSLREPGLHRACHDNVASIADAVARLAALGYRRIGLALAEEDDTRVKNLWIAGFLSSRHRLGAERCVAPLLAGTLSRVSFLDWFRSHRPDAVLGVAPAIPEWLRTSGLAAGVGFATLNWMPAHPRHAGYDQDFERIGAAAVDLVDAQLQRNERGVPDRPKLILVGGIWREGTTLERSLAEAPTTVAAGDPNASPAADAPAKLPAGAPNVRFLHRRKPQDAPVGTIQPIFGAFNTVSVRKRYVYERHRHSDYQVLLIDRGRYRCTLNDSPLALGPGEILIVKPGDWHEDTCLPPLDYSAVNFELAGPGGRNAADVLFARGLAPEAQVLRHDTSPIWTVVARMRLESRHDDPVASHVQSALLLEFFWRLVRALPEDRLSARFVARSRERAFALRLESLFADHRTEFLTVAAMARRLGVGVRTLQNRCHDLLSASPARCQMGYKMRAAAELVATGGTALKQVSFQLGFRNQHHFSRVFRQWHGQPPSQRRRLPA